MQIPNREDKNGKVKQTKKINLNKGKRKALKQQTKYLRLRLTDSREE